MSLISRISLIARLRRGGAVRQRFVESHLTKTVAHQIRSMREMSKLTQEELADKIGTTQNGVYRLESPDYGRFTLTTLKRVAAAFDVALVVRFVPFSELVDWVSGTPRVERGLRTSSFEVASFDADLGESAPKEKRPADVDSLGDVQLKFAKRDVINVDG